MRLVSFEFIQKSSETTGVFCGAESSADTVINLSAAYADKGTVLTNGLIDFLALGEAGLEFAKSLMQGSKYKVTRSAVRLVAPIGRPSKILCIGMNYVDHCVEQNFPIPKEPIVFSKFSTSVISSGDDIISPLETKKLDYEVELVIVIGKQGRRIEQSEALDYVAGYTVAHDVSARDWQMEKNGGNWLLGKTFDTFCPIGPCIVTKDSIDPHNLGLRTIVNNQVKQDSNTKELIFKTEELVAWCSKFTTLLPGDLILTGTPPGVICFQKNPVWLKDGDVVTVEIDQIGSITNTVREEAKLSKI